MNQRNRGQSVRTLRSKEFKYSPSKKNNRGKIMKGSGTTISSLKFPTEFFEGSRTRDTDEGLRLKTRNRSRSLKTWTYLSNSLVVNDERNYIRNQENDYIRDFQNESIIISTRKSIFSERFYSKKRSNSCQNRILPNGEEVTWARYKKEIRKTKVSRRNLHGLSKKNYNIRKHCVYEHREKFHGEDRFDEFA